MNIAYTCISPNRTIPRRDRIRKITIHHMAGNFSLEAVGNGFANPARQASANYAIDSDGRIGLYVEEKDRAWTSSSPSNDNQAVTIEVANDGGANWHVSDKALSTLIELCADICRRNGIERLNFTGDKNGNLTMHKYFAATICPGPYLASKFPYIAKEVNERLSIKTSEITVCMNGIPTKLPTILYNDENYVRLRSLAEAQTDDRFSITWDEKTKTVIINSK